jgi:hypothetical protein
MPTEPVILTVSQVRAALAAAEPARNPAPVNSLTGRMFHSIAARVLTADDAGSWQRLGPDGVDSPETIERHLYQVLLGPRLERRRAALQGGSEEVRYLWQALRGFSQWLSEVLRAARESGQIRYDEEHERWQVSEGFAETERPLAWVVREKRWRSAVRVEGRLDAAIGHASRKAWCIVEYKLSRGPSFADLAQLCLYREMLAGETGGEGSIALVRFGSETEETFYSGEGFFQVRQRLIELIGSLAAVSEAPPAAGTEEPSHAELGSRLVKALAELGARARPAGPAIAGPAFLRFPLAPERGVRSSAILKLGQELQVRLGLGAPPLLHISETGQVVADVPRPDRQTVPFGDVCNQLAPPDDLGMGTQFPVGVNLDGKLHSSDLAANPHVLVAGTTGSGKSEWLRMALAGLLLRNTPETLRLVCIDPKMNAFGDLKRSPFLLTERALVYPPEDSALDAFDEMIGEMLRRQTMFAKAGADDLRDYVRKTGAMLPRIVCFCDEYANLIGSRQDRVAIEERIGRLGSMGRSSGIHLFIATQQPSRRVVGGALQTNMSCRVALMTKSAIESRMLLEESGAESLLGQGDLLFWDIGRPIRLQAPYVSETDRKRIFLGKAAE